MRRLFLKLLTILWDWINDKEGRDEYAKWREGVERRRAARLDGDFVASGDIVRSTGPVEDTKDKPNESGDNLK